MGLLTATNAAQAGAFPVSETVLTADDTVPFSPNRRQLLVLRNDTGAPIAAALDGAGGTSVTVDGLGAVSVAGGYQIAVPAGNTRAEGLSTVKHYCQGVVHLTGGTGLKAQLFDL